MAPSLIRCRRSSSVTPLLPLTHSEPGRCPPEPFYRPQGGSLGVIMLRSKWSEFIVTSSCTVWSQRDSHWTDLEAAGVPNTRDLLPMAPLHSAPTPQQPLPCQLTLLHGVWGIAAFAPGSESSLSFPEQEVGKEGQTFGKEGPSAKRKSEMLLRGPSCVQHSPFGQLRWPGTDREQRGSPCPSQSSSPPKKEG